MKWREIGRTGACGRSAAAETGGEFATNPGLRWTSHALPAGIAARSSRPTVDGHAQRGRIGSVQRFHGPVPRAQSTRRRVAGARIAEPMISMVAG